MTTSQEYLDQGYLDRYENIKDEVREGIRCGKKQGRVKILLLTI